MILWLNLQLQRLFQSFPGLAWSMTAARPWPQLRVLPVAALHPWPGNESTGHLVQVGFLTTSQASPLNTTANHGAPPQLSPIATTCLHLKGGCQGLPHYLLFHGSFPDKFMENWRLPPLCSCCTLVVKNVQLIDFLIWLFPLLNFLMADATYYLIFLFTPGFLQVFTHRTLQVFHKCLMNK